MSFLISKIINSARSNIINQITNSVRTLSAKPLPVPLDNVNSSNDKKCAEIINNVREQLKEKNEGRLFAIVHLCGKQFKVTAGDLVVIEGYWPPTTGDKIRLDKVMLAGGKDFTLIGRPLLNPGLVDVQATIIEKTLTHTKTHFRKKRRKQYMRINFYRYYNTMIRINSVEVKGKIDEAAKDQGPRMF